MDIKADISTEVKIPFIEKFLDLVGKYFGKKTKQKYDKQDIDTEVYRREMLGNPSADEIKQISNAIKENGLEISSLDYKDGKVQISAAKPLNAIDVNLEHSVNLLNRTQERVLTQQLKKQSNLESILDATVAELQNEPDVSSEPVADEWMAEYMDFAGDVTDKDMQNIWAKILAGEIKRPKTYSLRTLEVLRKLSKEEAEIVLRIASFAIRNNKEYFLANLYAGYPETIGFGFLEISSLVESGILQERTDGRYFISANQTGLVKFILGDVVMIVQNKTGQEIIIPIIAFTRAGSEILRLITAVPNLPYFYEVMGTIKRPDVVIQLAKIITNDGINITHENPVEAFDN